MTRLFVLLAVLLTSGCAVWKLSGPYSGVVQDRETGAPIPGAAVLAVYQTEALSPAGSVSRYFDARETVTDAQGEFRIPLRLLLAFRPLHVWAKGPQLYFAKAEYGEPGHGDTAVRRGGVFEPWNTWPLPEGKTLRVSLPPGGGEPHGPSSCPVGHCDSNGVPFNKMREFARQEHLAGIRHGVHGEDAYDVGTELFLAVGGNDLEQIDRLITRGLDPDLRNSVGHSPLCLAAKRGFTEAAAVLIERGAAVDGAGIKGVTPLIVATSWRKPDLAELLVAKGADINLPDGFGRTPLMAACLIGDADLVELLIARGARIDATDSQGWQPLHAASAFPRILEMLLARGADVNAQDRWGWTALNLAIRRVWQEERLARSRTAHRPGSSPESPAAEPERITKIAVLLLDHGLDPRLRDQQGWSHLAVALSFDSWEVARLLMDRGADVNAATNLGETPLLLLSSKRRSDLDVAALLLARGAQPDRADSRGDTALLRSVRSGNEPLARVLIERGADVNRRNRAGETPLGLARASRQDDLAALLVAHGARE